jgi:hypothetical protein
VVQLPGQDAIAPLPDNLPRRIGVGGWRPEVLEQNAQQFAHGFETLGMDIGLYDASQQRAQDALSQAKARSAAEVSNIQTQNDLANETDPAKAAGYIQKFQGNVNSAASMIPEGPQRDNFLTEQAPTLARSTVGVFNHINNLNNNQDLADFTNNETTAINAALSTPDDAQRGRVLANLQAQGQALVDKGVMTPEQWALRQQNVAKTYGITWTKNEALTADQTGDTSRIRAMLPNFLTSPDGAGGATPVPNDLNWAKGSGSFQAYGAQNDLPQKANFLMGAAVSRLGASQTGAAAIVGNAVSESGLSTTVGNWKNEDSHGLFQWNDAAGVRRWSKFQEWATSIDADPGNPMTQLAYAKVEASQMRGPNGMSVWQAVNSAPTVKEASDIWMRYFEAPKDQGAGASAARAREAMGAYRTYSTGQPNAFVGLPPPAQVASPDSAAVTQVDFSPTNPQPIPPRAQWPDGAASAAHTSTGELVYVGHDGTPLGGQTGGGTPANEGGAAPLSPPRSQWPDGAKAIVHQGDGSLAYVMSDGTLEPVPGSRATGSPGAMAPTKTGTILDHIPPQERAELGIYLANEATRIERRNYEASKQQVTLAKESMKGIQSDLVNGQPVPDQTINTIVAPLLHHPNPEVKQMAANIMNIRDNLAHFKGQTPAQVEDGIINQQAEYNQAVKANPGDPLNEMRFQTLQASKAYLKAYQTDISKNTLERAVREDVLPNGLTPLNPTDPSIVQEFTQRAAEAQKVADFYHLPEPVYLTQQDRVQFKRMAAAGGQPMAELAANAVAGLGSRAGTMFKQIGGDAPAFVSLGQLMLQGTSKQNIDDIAHYTAAANDKEAKRDLPRITDSVLARSKADDPLGTTGNTNNPLEGFGPDYQGRIRQTANILGGAWSARDGKDPKIDLDTNYYTTEWFNRAYTAALGGEMVNGKQYGGVANYGGGNFFSPSTWNNHPMTQKILVPPNVKAEDMGSLVARITDDDLSKMPRPPVDPAGHPISAAQIRNGYLTAIPDQDDGIFHGRYGVILGDPHDEGHRPVLSKDGKPFELNLSAGTLAEALKKRSPESYRDAPPPLRGPGAPLRNLPGMLEAGEEPATATATE